MYLKIISGRGWVTIDTDIFFWNYETGGDLAYYEGLAEVVLSVGLITPKPGIFQPHIKFLLVVCTASEVIVLGVTFQSEGDDTYALMHLQPNPLFSISSDSVNMIQVFTHHILHGSTQTVQCTLYTVHYLQCVLCI